MTWPQGGDQAVDIWVNTAGGPDRLGPTVTITAIALGVILTSAGERYHLSDLTSFTQGRYSAHRLAPLTDDRVLRARGREHLVALSNLAGNLTEMDHRTPESIIAALAQIITTADESRRALLALMAEASRVEKESTE